MNKQDVIIIYLSLSLLALQFFWVKDIRQAEYQRGRAEMLEIMAEQTDTGPYTAKKVVHH